MQLAIYEKGKYKWSVFFCSISIISLLTCPCIGFSEERLAKTFYNNLRTDLKFQYFITGVGEAANFINGILEDEGKNKLYCQPDIALSVENYVQIYLDAYEFYKGDAAPETMMPQHFLIAGLRRTFPCK